jgi:peroxiredoxin
MVSSELNLQNISLTSYKHNQVQHLGYADVFLHQRIVLIGLSNIYESLVFDYVNAFDLSFNEVESLGIDKIYCVSSDELTVAPWAEKHFVNVIGLADKSKELISALKQYANINVNIDELSTHWQYIAVFNNGTIEKLFFNHYKSGLPLKIIKDPRYRYHGLSVSALIQYLKQT